MRLGKKLLDVASNFFEIEREEKPASSAVRAESLPALPVASGEPGFETPPAALPQAEQELDAFMRGMDAEAAADATAHGAEIPTPNSTISAEGADAEVSAAAEQAQEPIFDDAELMNDLRVVVGDDGEIDFARIYRSAKVPEARFSAEQAVNMLNALLENLPIAIKRKTVNATLAALGNPMGAAPDAIREDATRKKESLSVYLDAVTLQTEQFCHEAVDEIARMEVLLSEYRERKETAVQKQAIAWEQCRRQMGLMDEVTVFFQEATEEVSAPAFTAATEEETDPMESGGDLPSFMTNDTAYRLLGITGEAPSLEQIVEEGGFEVDASTLEAQAENPENQERSSGRRRIPRSAAAAAE